MNLQTKNTTKFTGQTPRFSLTPLAACLAGVFALSGAPLALALDPGALPTNGQVAAGAAAITNAPEFNAVLTQKKFNFEQIESSDYQTYIKSLRAVGCPEDKVRYIIMADINELFAKKRKDVAITNDSKWWKAQTDIMIANALQQKGRELEEERRSMIERLLGSDALENEKSHRDGDVKKPSGFLDKLQSEETKKADS